MSTFETVINKFKTLRFNCIADSLETLVSQSEDNQISYLQFADALVSHELSQRDKKRFHLNMKRAVFPAKKKLEEFDYRAQTTITKKQINQLLDYSFIDNRENIIFIGPPGVGKTHLAVGIGHKSVEAGYKVLFLTALGLIECLDLAEVKGELKKKINTIMKFDVLIIDELGYLPMNRQGMYNLFQLINSMYEYRSIIITTNKDFTNWGDFFFDDNVAVPIVDRIIHHSHIFMLGGESYRLRQKTDNN
jgi:DNA replication protein DnaC